MSTRELRRAEVLGRVKSKTLRLADAAKILELSYRQTKRLWKRYREEGAKGLQHRSAGRGSNCGMGEQETIWAAAGVLRSWIEKHGVPRALYTDWKNVYKREPTERERLQGKAPTTQFGRMCERLEIRIIAANSPQAKGRVERNNGVHQDRLVKKLRRKGIQDYEAANAYLEAE